jgi:TRAP transporter T-component
MKNTPLTYLSIFLSLLLGLSGCFSGQQLISSTATPLFQDIARSAGRQADLNLVRQGLPSYLMMIDGLILSYPDNQDLLLAGAQAYASYASVLEEEDQARVPPLLTKAKDYALQALLLQPPFKDGIGRPIDLFQKQLEAFEKKDVSLLFWTANIWATWIASSPDSLEAMTELPWVEAIMERTLQLDPGFYYGGPHLFKAILLSLRPAQFGGNLKKAQTHFEEAFKYGEEKFLMAKVYYAQYYARQTLDKELFLSTLNKVLSVPADLNPDLTLANTLAQKKARTLLNKVDEWFE